MGYSAVTTVLSAAASYDLTDLATAKDELSIAANNTAEDGWLGRAIKQMSQSIATHTERVLVPEVVQDVIDIQQDPYPYQTPGGFPDLVLSRWPVIAVFSVVQTLAVGVTQTLVEGVDYRADPVTGQLLRLNPFTGVGSTWEAIPVTIVYLAGYGSLITEAAEVPAVTPFQVTISQSAAFSCDRSVVDAGGTSLVRVAANPAAGQYSVAAGIYTFNSADASKSLTFTYAVKAIPDDLVGICLRLMTARYRAKDRDPSLVQQDTPGVGMQRWWFGNAPGQKGPFPPDIEAALDPYCTSVVV